jgi:hypothetical protein
MVRVMSCRRRFGHDQRWRASVRRLAKDPTATPDHLSAFLTEPHGGMRELSLSRREIDDLVAYIESLK